jgi:hypothetical protein
MQVALRRVVWTSLVAALVPSCNAFLLPRANAIGFYRVAASPPARLGVAIAGWSDSTWNWGSSVGDAHNEAQRVRAALLTPEARSEFIQNLYNGERDLEEAKLVLALKCQRAKKVGYDRHDKGWETLMDAMAACEFEGDAGEEKLTQAIRGRLKNQSALYQDATAKQWIAIALNNLGFMERGV